MLSSDEKKRIWQLLDRQSFFSLHFNNSTNSTQMFDIVTGDSVISTDPALQTEVG